jgi:hypothetical protein
MARLSGKDISLYFWNGSSFARVADLYEWELNYEDVLLDVSIKGDTTERLEPSHFRGTLTAKRWVEDIGTGALVFGPLAANAARVEFALLGIDPLSDTTASAFTTTSVRVQGTGYVTRGRTMAQRENIQDDFELRVDGPLAVYT